MTDRTFLDSGRHEAMSSAVHDMIMGPAPTGANRDVPLPKRTGVEQDREDGAGFNYVPRNQAGHKIP